ncbi:MAG: sensor histidine kinase, partial [Clostridiales bacterium]
YRADGARTQKNGGYGIGLSVARAIAAANNGILNAAYLPPNRICFTICF